MRTNSYRIERYTRDSWVTWNDGSNISILACALPDIVVSLVDGTDYV